MEPEISALFASLPGRFRPEKAGAYAGRFHFDLNGPAFTVEIEAGICSVTPGLKGEPDCVVRSTAAHYIAVELGKTKAQMAIMTGKIKVSNLVEMARFAGLFRRYRPELAQAAAAPRRPTAGPLLGIRILDLSRLLPGPMAGGMLAALGAEVIKIEDPSAPDESLNYPPDLNGVGAYYIAPNHGKRNLGLNLYSEAGKRIFMQLAAGADVVLESFRPGVLDKMGLGYAALKAQNPRIILVSLSGYGQNGPYARQAGHDLNYISMSGLLGLNGGPDGLPALPGGQIADIAGGAYLGVLGALAALQGRANSGRGDHVDISMLEGVLPLLTIPMAAFFATGEAPRRGRMDLAGALANYAVYTCADGKTIALAALEPRFFSRFCEIAGHSEWAPRIAGGPEAHESLRADLQRLFLSRSRAEWLALTEGQDVCLSPVLNPDEVLNDPHLQARGAFFTYRHPVYGETRGLRLPLRFAEQEPAQPWAAPLPGEDSDAIMETLGYSPEEISRLRAEGVLG